MPKKHQPHYNKITAAHNSNSSGSQSSTLASANSSSKSVNERLNELRREANPLANAHLRDEFASAVAPRNIPMTPTIRRILDIPEGSTPISRARPRRRRVPGPAAPRSWLEASKHAPTRADEDSAHLEDDIGKFSTLAKLEDSPLGLPNVRSLAHYALKKLTSHWEELAEFEQFHLPTLPINLKGQILSYLAAYSTYDGLALSSFKLLFPRDSETGGLEKYEDVNQVDLTGLLSNTLTVSALNKFITRSTGDELPTRLKELSLGDSLGDNVAESWETEAETVKLDPAMRTIRFPNLTRLSLSHPGPQASWLQLLELSRNLPKLTHLSLAYWPSPSLTPNAATTSVTSRYSGPVALGGTHYYSELDNDWYEAANILRRLSNSLYCLEWLDLEGCTWAGSALSWSSSQKKLALLSVSAENPPNDPMSDSFDDLEDKVDVGGLDFNGPWRQLSYINLSQGWIPCDTESIRSMPAGQLSIQLLSYLRKHDGMNSGRTPLRNPSSTSSLRTWLDRERDAMNFERDLRSLRHAAQGKFCKVDRGWEAVQVKVRQKENDGAM